MIRHAILLLLTMLLSTSCTALPAEERAFAVALCVDRTESAWHVYGRIPVYQTGGGYMTVPGKGETLTAALADMEDSAPMHLHLSQLRLLVVSETLAHSSKLSEVLHTLSQQQNMHLQCAVALSEAPMEKVAEALKPTTGARLSKSIDVLLNSRREQGEILHARLGDVLRMDERQSPVLMALKLEKDAFNLSGGYALTADWQRALPLTAEECALLALLLGEVREVGLSVPGGNASMRKGSVRVSLEEDSRFAQVDVTLHRIAAPMAEVGMEQHLADAFAALLSRLSSAGCDVLGLGRKVIVQTEDMAQWHAFNWPERLKQLAWRVSVHVQGPT